MKTRYHAQITRGKPAHDTIRGAAVALNVPVQVLRAAKARGCPGFRSGRVHAAEVAAWLAVNPIDAADVINAREAKLREEVRGLKARNDATEAQLVRRDWMAERFQRVLGELHALRAKSEAEHALRFRESGSDTAQCRTVLRGIWSDIFTGIAELGKHFDDEHGPAVAAQPRKT